jgi:Secretion system C-terminal sorting domain
MDRNSHQSGFGFKVFRKVFCLVFVLAFLQLNSLYSQAAAGPYPIQGDTDICIDAPNSYSTNFNQNAQYNWNAIGGTIASGQGTHTATATWANAGTHALALKVTIGAAMHVDTAWITTNTPPQINMGPDGAFCNQGLLLTPGPGFDSYLWQSGGVADSVYPQAPGTYWCRVTDDHGCQACDTVHLTNGVPQPSLYPAGPISFCEGNSEMLFAPPGYADYLWNGQSGGQTAIVSQTMTVILTVVDSLGCSNSSSATSVTAIPLPTPNIYINGAVFSTDSAPSYEWFLNGVTLNLFTQSITVTATGNYTVQVSNANDCSGSSGSVAYSVPTATEAEAAHQLSVAPNPSNGAFHLDLPSDWETSDLQIALYDLSGRAVPATFLQAGHRIDVDATLLAAGIYTLSANTTNASASARVVVAR